jgi:hypothetical protein
MESTYTVEYTGVRYASYDFGVYRELVYRIVDIWNIDLEDILFTGTYRHYIFI